MNMMKRWVVGLALATVVSGVHAAAVIEIDGSSTVYPITEAVAEEYQVAMGGARVTVGISGTGGGFKRFCRGEIDIANASRPILKEEMIACAQAGIRYYELPIAYDALTVVVSKSNTFVDQLTIDELKRMWEPAAAQKITNWNQVRPTFPKLPLKLAGAGADSGTFDYWTEAVMKRSKASRGDYQASEDDNVTVQYVSRDKGALGYLGMAYFEENAEKLRAVPIVPPHSTNGAASGAANGAKKGVVPSAKTVNNGTYQPLSRPLFIYVKEKSLQRPEIKTFVEFFLTEGPALAAEVGYVELPANAYTLARQNLKNRKIGSGFAGVAEIGLTVEQLLVRERKR